MPLLASQAFPRYHFEERVSPFPAGSSFFVPGRAGEVAGTKRPPLGTS